MYLNILLDSNILFREYNTYHKYYRLKAREHLLNKIQYWYSEKYNDWDHKGRESEPRDPLMDLNKFHYFSKE